MREEDYCNDVFPVTKHLSIICSLWTAIYVFVVLLGESTNNKIDFNWYSTDGVKLVVFTIIIIVLPYYQRFHYNFGMNTLTAILLVVSVAQLQLVVKSAQGLIAYIVIALLVRIISNNSFADNFAICCAFTANAVFIDMSKLNWNIVSNLLLWSYFSLAFLNLHIQRRSSVRIWEHSRAIIILREKTKKEKLRGEKVISAHFPEEVLRHLFPSSDSDKLTSFVSEKSATMSDVSVSSNRKNAFAKKSGKAFINAAQLEDLSKDSNGNDSHDVVVNDALVEGLIPQFSESRLSLQQLKAIDG